MRDVAASGGYMISLAADRVFAYKGTITGSIGVVMQSAEFVDLANKLGIQFSSFKSSPLKAAPNTFEKVTPEIREALQSVIDDSYQTFFDLVSERRKIQPSVLKQIADGRIYTGNQAVKLNLIDEIGDEDSAIEWLQKNKGIDKSVDIVDIDLVQTPNKLESLLDKATSFLHYFTVLLFNRQVLY